MKINHYLIACSFAIAPYTFLQKLEAKNISVNIDPIEQSNKLEEEGVKKWRTKDNHGAIKDYTEALKFNPKNVGALFGRAYSKWELKDYEGAHSDFNKILKTEPDKIHLYTLHNLSLLNFETKNFEEGVEVTTKLISQNFQLNNSYTNRGLYKENLGDAKGACADYRKGSENGNEIASLRVKESCEPNVFKAFEKKTKNNMIMNRARKKYALGDGKGSCEDYQLAKSNGYVPPKKHKLFYKVFTDPYCFFRTI